MTDSLLGTPLQAARDDDRPRTLIVSDLHVPHEGGRVMDSLRQLLADAAAQAEHTRVLILGDLFDYLTCPKHLTFGAYRDVVAALRDTVEAGVTITVLHGNRDYMLDRTFERSCGARVVPGGLRFQLGERRCLALHGDELCLFDKPYLRAKRVLRNPMVKAIARRMPLSVALRLGALTRGTVGASPLDWSDRYEPVARARREVLELGVDLLVFGHIHRPARGEFEGLGEYCILPAFDTDGVHLEFAGGRLRYRSVAGDSVEDYPARTFPG